MKTQYSIDYFEAISINIVADEDAGILEFSEPDSILTLHPKSIEDNSKSKIVRMNNEKVKTGLQIVGCKMALASTISDKIFKLIEQQIQKEPIPNILGIQESERVIPYTTKSKFLEVLKKTLADHSLTKDQTIFDFDLAIDIIEQKKSMIVLLGGTSGSGKSTVSSLLASRFGISTVLSTDSIRHVMRNFMTTDECPVLFASTYEAGQKIKVEDEDISEKKRIVLGFQQQSQLIQQKLEQIIEQYQQRGESIIIEGVHLTPDFMINLMKQYKNCIPFVIFISNENKHKERFAVRSKYMTLDRRANKYVQNFAHIRVIQKHITKRADQYLIPKVDNSNIDKSVGLIHRTIQRCIRRIYNDQPIYDHEKRNAFVLHENFNKVTKNVWSSKAVQQYIDQKSNKNELLRRFLAETNNLTNDEELANAADQEDDNNHHDEDEESPVKQIPSQLNKIKIRNDSPPITTHELKLIEDLGSDDVKQIQTPPKKTSFKEDTRFIEQKPREMKPPSQRNSAQNGNSAIKDKADVLGSPNGQYSRRDHKSELNSSVSNKKNIKKLTPVKSNSMSPLPSKQPIRIFKAGKNLTSEFTDPDDSREDTDDDKGSRSPRGISFNSELFSNRSEISEETKENSHLLEFSAGTGSLKRNLRFQELEELLASKKVISLKGNLTYYHIRTIRRFIANYNRKKFESDHCLRLIPSHERYLIQKQLKEKEKENSPHPNMTEPTFRSMMYKSKKSEESMTRVDSGSNLLSLPAGNSGIGSENDIDRSDDEGNSSLEKSNMSGSLEVNHLTKVGYTLSERFEMSDDFESRIGDDENVGSQYASMEIIESANSISEQTEEEEDEDDDDEIYNNKAAELQQAQSQQQKQPSMNLINSAQNSEKD